MQTNLDEGLRWLQLNPSAPLTGFEYAPTASQNMTKPTVFNFDTTRTRAAHNCALSSIGAIGMIDLEVYRAREVAVTHSSNNSVSSATAPPPMRAKHPVPAVTPAANPTVNFNNPAPTEFTDIPDEVFMNIDVEGLYRYNFCVTFVY